MSYSTNLVKTAAEADTLLLMAARDKRDLLHIKETRDLRAEHAAENLAAHNAELELAKTELASTIALIATLAEGSLKDAQEIKKMELDLKIRKLSKPKAQTDAVAVLQDEYDSQLKDRQIAVIDEFTQVITAKKASL